MTVTVLTVFSPLDHLCPPLWAVLNALAHNPSLPQPIVTGVDVVPDHHDRAMAALAQQGG